MSLGAGKSLRVAAVQLCCRDRVADNLQVCEQVVADAAARGAELIALPENFAYLGAESGKRPLAERVGDATAPIQRFLSAQARRHGVSLLAGGMPELSSDPERPFNASLLYDADGNLAAHYRKLHLFDVELPDGTVLSESKATTRGADTKPVVAQVAGWGVGLSICYDLRFPELYRAQVSSGAEVLTVPSAFTIPTGKDHWHVLLRARAIECQSYVVAPAQWGKHPAERASYGHSLIVDPWGTVLADCSDQVGFVEARLDGGYLEQVRRRLPALEHRRADLK